MEAIDRFCRASSKEAEKFLVNTDSGEGGEGSEDDGSNAKNTGKQ